MASADNKNWHVGEAEIKDSERLGFPPLTVNGMGKFPAEDRSGGTFPAPEGINSDRPWAPQPTTQRPRNPKDPHKILPADF